MTTILHLPWNHDDNYVINELETKNDFLDARKVMTEIFRTKTALPESISPREQQTGRLQIKEQKETEKMMAIYDKVYFELLQDKIEKDYVGDAIQNA